MIGGVEQLNAGGQGAFGGKASANEAGGEHLLFERAQRCRIGERSFGISREKTDRHGLDLTALPEAAQQWIVYSPIPSVPPKWVVFWKAVTPYAMFMDRVCTTPYVPPTIRASLLKSSCAKA